MSAKPGSKEGTEPGRPLGGREHLTPSGFVESVLLTLADGGRLQPSSLVTFTEVLARFGRFCERGLGLTDARDIEEEHVRAFISAIRRQGGEPSLGTKHLRRNSVRLAFREGRRLGLVTGDPTRDIELPYRTVLATRPLTDAEVDLCRLFALDSQSDRLAVIWALCESTARIAELPSVRVADVDLVESKVFLAGTGRALARWAPMTEWAAAQVERRLRHLGQGATPEVGLVPWRPKSLQRPSNAGTMAVIGVLQSAGVHDQEGVRPNSVVAWAGARLLRSGAPIQDVARALGCRSLDRTAEMIGHDWRATPPESPA